MCERGFDLWIISEHEDGAWIFTNAGQRMMKTSIYYFYSVIVREMIASGAVTTHLVEEFPSLEYNPEYVKDQSKILTASLNRRIKRDKAINDSLARRNAHRLGGGELNWDLLNNLRHSDNDKD